MKKFIGYEKGINFGGWLSQCNHTCKHYDEFIAEKDFAQVASLGLDHVRIPIDYTLLENEIGEPTAYGMDYIQKAVEWCEKYKLNMILDLHKTCGFSFDKGEQESGFFTSESLQERFYCLWERLAQHFGSCTRIAFELLNEVTDREYCEKWNAISEQCVQRIRKIAPNVFILIGGYENNSVMAIPDLKMPYDDKIVYNFHCYEPLIFTHQGAYWVDGMPQDFRLAFPGETREYAENQKRLVQMGLKTVDLVTNVQTKMVNSAYFETLFAKAVAIAEERETTLYCGEYGVIDLADSASTVSWYKAIHQAFEKYGISRAAWCYKGMDFGLTDHHMIEKIMPYL